MGIIHELDESTINQIAAGEVIERPASVVKELVENAIDAGASAVTVEIREGGISLIRITDNGAGIAKEDIRIAFERHTTSKIRNAEDLLSVSSLGFRGEALSSIAAVAQVEVLTKRRQDIVGVRYVIEGGVERSLEEIGTPDGTTFVVKNLFYHTPARRKFLKTAAGEAGQVSEIIERIALSHPGVSIRYIVNGQNKMHTSGNHKLKDCIYQVYGREIAENLIDIDTTAPEEGMAKTGQEAAAVVSVSGYAGKPVIARGNRSYEIYFVNGRYIKSPLIAKAIEDAYQPYLMQHKYPLVVLQLKIDPEQLDVNVHPAKMEIRFKDRERIYRCLYDTLSAALRAKPAVTVATLPEPKKNEPMNRTVGAENIPAISAGNSDNGATHFRQDPVKAISGRQETTENEPFRKPLRTTEIPRTERPEETGQDPFRKPLNPEGIPQTERSEETAQDLLQKPQDSAEISGAARPEEIAQAPFRETTKSAEISVTAHPEDTARTSLRESPNLEEISETEYSEVTESEPILKPIRPAEIFETERLKEEEVVYGARRAEEKRRQERESAAAAQMLQMSLFDEEDDSQKKKNYRIIGQVFETYWIVEFENQMYIIDQHAAHEKILYERTMKSFASRQYTVQQINPPIIIHLSMREEQLLSRYMDYFTAIGFEIEHFGERDYAVRGVPDNLFSISKRDLLIDLIDSLDDLDQIRDSKLIQERVASMSCKAAIKGNNRISTAEATRLIDELLTLDQPFHCPHGRPTIITMSKYELEKKFKRIL